MGDVTQDELGRVLKTIGDQVRLSPVASLADESAQDGTWRAAPVTAEGKVYTAMVGKYRHSIVDEDDVLCRFDDALREAKDRGLVDIIDESEHGWVVDPGQATREFVYGCGGYVSHGELVRLSPAGVDELRHFEAQRDARSQQLLGPRPTDHDWSAWSVAQGYVDRYRLEFRVREAWGFGEPPAYSVHWEASSRPCSAREHGTDRSAVGGGDRRRRGAARDRARADR